MRTSFRDYAAAIGIATLLIAAPNGDGSRADMASATVLANTCFSCHGTEGASVGAMPSVKGKPADFIENQLMAFRDGKRASTVMSRIAKGFTVDEIKALSQYFSSQK